MGLFAHTARIAAAMILVAAPASAARIDAFTKSTNDGVYELTQAQIDHFGVEDAAYIGFYRPRFRKADLDDYAIGDVFDADTILASAANQSSANKILAVLNGDNQHLDYTGGLFDPLGTTVIESVRTGYVRGVAFLFGDDVGNIVFQGTSTFNEGQSRGLLAFDPPPSPTGPAGSTTPAAVPLPAGLVLLATGAGALGLMRRRSS